MEKKRKLTQEEIGEIFIINPTPATKEDYAEFMKETFNYMSIHGPIVGVIIQINTNMLQESTIFFSDGFTNTSEVPIIGYDIEKNNEYRFNLLAAKEIIGSIFRLAPKIEGDYICTRGTKEEIKEAQEYGMTCYFVFRPIEDGIVDFGECIGTWMLDEQIKIIAEDEYSEFMQEIET